MADYIAHSDSFIVEKCAYPGKGFMVTISRATDGHCLAIIGRKVVSEIRSCIKSHGIEKTVATYEKAFKLEWKPLYTIEGVRRH